MHVIYTDMPYITKSHQIVQFYVHLKIMLGYLFFLILHQKKICIAKTTNFHLGLNISQTDKNDFRAKFDIKMHHMNFDGYISLLVYLVDLC